MYIEELDTLVSTREDKLFHVSLLSSDPIDPMDSLIEYLRGEFKRQFVRQAQEKEAAKRKRLVALTLVIAPVGLMMAAALAGRASAHPRMEASRQETLYGR